MNTITSKKHYLTKSFTGFENYFKTKVVAVENYSNDIDNLIIYMRVNPTNDQYISLSERVDVTVIYNVVTDKFKVKPEGKGSRLHGNRIKREVADIIESLVIEANNNFTYDSNESKSLTVDNLCNSLKENGGTVEQSNQLYYDINHTYETVEECLEGYTAIVNSLSAVEEVETFQLYNNTFATYNEAFTYAVNNNISVSMILSNKNESITNDELMRLESSYVFDKMNMRYDDMTLYFNYLESIPNSLDRENRYYKIKNWIERFNNKAEEKELAKSELNNDIKETESLFKDMLSNGLKVVENESMVKWYKDDENVYTWFTGIGMHEYMKAIRDTHSLYFS